MKFPLKDLIRKNCNILKSTTYNKEKEKMKTNSNWFTERNLRVLDYQQNTITKVFDSLNERDITVLAASPSAGKTLMTIFVIEEYIKLNPNTKVLVLAHGTTILRSQFHDVLVEYKPNFTFYCATSCDEYQLYSKTKQVVVTLPQTISRCGNLNEIDLLVVDEAHLIANKILETKYYGTIIYMGINRIKKRKY
jgi:superfamily II DNA or RNA helicase